MRITSSGNVGIGTTSPDRKIHVEGGYYLKGGAANTSYVADGLWGATATPNLLNSTSGGLGLRIGYQDNGSGLYSPAYGFEVKSTDGIPVAGRVQRAIVIKDVDTGLYPFYINNNGSAFFDGNVGIGDTTPEATLTVKKGSEGAYFSAGGDTANNRQLVFTSSNGNGSNGAKHQINATSLNGIIALATANVDRLTVGNTGNVGIGTTTPNAKLDVQGTQGQLFSVTDDLSGDIFSVADISGVPILNVNSNGTSYFDGNVGIGTTSPSYPLVVNGEIEASGDGYLINGYGWATEGSGVLTLGDWDGNEFSTRIMDENTNEVLRVANGGVGIGLTNPSAKLQVYRDNSTLAASLAEATSRASVKIRSSSTDGAHLVISQGASGCTQLQVSSTNGTTPRNIKIQPFGGNVGIGTGTANPSDKLVVVGNVVATNFVLSSDERKKTKIKDLTCNNIDVNWRSFELKQHEGEYRTGVIAQELEQSHPEFVKTDNEGFKSVKYIDLLIAKIAELEARLEKLEK
jgi:hypothetical protein